MAGRGRPPKALIQRDAVTTAALELIDAEGVDALSLRRIGNALGVHGMSLYYHFEDKQAILDAVAQRILSELRPSKSVPEDFVRWSLSNARRYRRALLAHPNAIPIFVARYPAAARRRMYDSEFAALEAQGVDEKYWTVFLETIEAFVVGSVLYLHPRADQVADTTPPDATRADDPAGRRSPKPPTGRDYEAGFDAGYRALVGQLLRHYQELSELSGTGRGRGRSAATPRARRPAQA